MDSLGGPHRGFVAVLPVLCGSSQNSILPSPFSVLLGQKSLATLTPVLRQAASLAQGLAMRAFGKTQFSPHL